MKDEANRQLAPISINEIKETLKKKQPDQFDKIIITDDEPVNRGNYVFVKFKYQIASRSLKIIKFPLYGAVKDNFAKLEGGVRKFGEKANIQSDSLFETLNKNYQISSVKLDSSKIDEVFNYPLDTQENQVNLNQRKYFLADHTFQENCSNCKGNQYVKCPDDECNGRHEYECPKCFGNRKVDCRTCDKAGFLKCNKCKGAGEYKCSKCSGKGEVKCGAGLSFGCNGKGYTLEGTKQIKCTRCFGKGYTKCGDCRDGIVGCAKCARKGELRCENCRGKGEVSCNYCNAAGRITCNTCYGNKDRRGMVDCPICETIGTMAQVVFVESNIQDEVAEKIIIEGKKLNFEEASINKYINKDGITRNIYNYINKEVITDDAYSKIYATEIENELDLNKKVFPLLTKEEIFYQVVPCVEISYKHMLTNKTHNLAIVNFWDNPEVIFYTEAEQLKQGVKNIAKSVKDFFAKLFKTNAFKTKGDRRNEIILLIYLAKADDKIEDQEKIYLSEMIGGLDDFTNAEKKQLFSLMSSKTLPELTKKDVFFSSLERANEVLGKLTELAQADGSLDEAEKDLISQIQKLLKI